MEEGTSSELRWASGRRQCKGRAMQGQVGVVQASASQRRCPRERACAWLVKARWSRVPTCSAQRFQSL